MRAQRAGYSYPPTDDCRDIYFRMYKRLITNVRSVKVGYQALRGLSAYGNGATKRGRTIALR